LRQFSTLSRLLEPLALALAAQSAAAVCSVGSPGLNFGAYDPRSGAPLDSAGTITVSGCVAGYTITLGSGSSASYVLRKMTAGSYHMNYNLYIDAARNSVWGDGTGGTSTVSSTGAGPFNHTVYGRIEAGQNIGAGSYTDLLVVTVIF